MWPLKERRREKKRQLSHRITSAIKKEGGNVVGGHIFYRPEQQAQHTNKWKAKRRRRRRHRAAERDSKNKKKKKKGTYCLKVKSSLLKGEQGSALQHQQQFKNAHYRKKGQQTWLAALSSYYLHADDLRLVLFGFIIVSTAAAAMAATAMARATAKSGPRAAADE